VAIVQCKDVEKQFVKGREVVEVLTGINLDLEEGSFLALMGPSGPGKTMLLNLIGGPDHPTEGAVVVGGADLSELSGSGLAKWRSEHVGFIFQFYNLLPILNAQRNVELPLLLTKLSRAQRKKNAATALEIVGLADRAKHKPGELSGGQQQRVAIARALVSNPAIVLADEPTGNLDTKAGEEIMKILLGLNQEKGVTLIIVTHDPEIAALTNRIVTIRDGRVENDK